MFVPPLVCICEQPQRWWRNIGQNGRDLSATALLLCRLRGGEKRRRQDKSGRKCECFLWLLAIMILRVASMDWPTDSTTPCRYCHWKCLTVARRTICTSERAHNRALVSHVSANLVSRVAGSGLKRALESKRVHCFRSEPLGQRLGLVVWRDRWAGECF